MKDFRHKAQDLSLPGQAYPTAESNSPDRRHRDWYQFERWRKLAKAQLRREPLCARCLDTGRVTLATVADHVVAHGGDWKGFCSANCKAFARRAIPAASSLKKYTIIIPTSGWTAFHSIRGIRSIAAAKS